MAVEQMSYSDEDLEKLKYTFPGLNSFYLALVWQFAEQLLLIQTALEQYEAAKSN